MSKALKAAITVATVAALVFAAASAAWAAPQSVATPRDASAQAAPAPLVGGQTSVQIGPGQEPNVTVALVTVQIDSGVKLPARVRIPVPPGSTIEWAGEILGGDPNADPQRPYTLHDGQGGAQYAELTLTQSRQGQIDVNAAPLNQSGTSVSTQVTYVQSVPSTTTVISVRMPPNTSNVRLTPAPSRPPDINATGESLYVLSVPPLATGAAQAISISYDLGAARATGSSSQIPVYVAFGIALLAVIIALVFVAQRSMMSGGGDDEDEADDEDAGEGYDESEWSGENELREDVDESATELEWGSADAFDDSSDPFDTGGSE